MCSISIVINGTKEQAEKMGEAVKHRGVRHNITSIDNIHVVFSCLPITDQDAPMQPYVYRNRMVWLNGFVSNWRELAVKYKIELETNCDTELLSKFPGPIEELNGFFSIVSYDQKEKKLKVITDRYGCKQLYRCDQGETTFICSELKGIKAVCDLELDPVAVDDWMYSLGVMTDYTIYKGVQRVPCWSMPTIDPISISYPEAKSRLKFLLKQSIRRNKVEGLKDGVFLSGGVDSGYLAKELNPDYCFSMDYQDEKYSEIKNIKLNSSGTHITMVCNPDLFDRYIDKTFLALDDLKAGSSWTNFALTETASKFCTVLYSGAGGDELFRGYTHRYYKNIQDVIRRTDHKTERVYPDITHEEYDWIFLKSILVVEDRMSGFHTMETRYPFLDNDLVDFVRSLPEIYKVNKRILKDVCGLKQEVIESPKRGWSNGYLTNYEWAQYAMNKITGAF
jgi:asparagine synthase (glutamine-hydrolysing)